MIERWFEAFTLLEKAAAPDGLGGETAALTPSIPFQGALTLTAGDMTNAAGQPVLAESPVLLHETDVTLVPGDHIRREKDGAVYRVTDRSDMLRAPAFSGLKFAQAPVERVVFRC